MANGNQLATLLGQGATMSPSGQTQIDLARSLASGAIGGGPVRGGPIEALSRVGQAFFARKLMEQQQEEQAQRQQGIQDTLRNALASRTGGQPGSAAFGPPDPQQLSQALMTNPDTAQLGAQIGLSQALQGQEPTRQTISGDQANQLFGTSLASGAAVTVEKGPQGTSIVGVESPQSTQGTQTERQVRRLMARGFDRPTAEDIAFGRIDTETDDFGRTWLVNVATGERRLASEIQDREEEPAVQPPPDGEGSAGIESAAMEGTGPLAAARQLGNVVIGPFMEGQPFPKTENARQSLRIFNQQIKQSLTANPKNPVAELNTIQGFLPNPDRILTDPDGERAKIRQLREFLKQRRNLNQQQMDTGFIPTDVKSKFAEQNAQIDQALTLMDEFGGGASDPDGNQFTIDNPANPQTREEYEDLPSGAFFIDDEGLKRKP